MRNFNLDDESFNIKPEIKVAQIINRHSKKIRTEKNMDDIYHYDLKVFDCENGNHIGFIEVEVSNWEKLGGPKWQHSFLARKIYVYNENGYKSQQLKPDAEKTIYIKFNKNFGIDDCICCSIESITFFEPDFQNKTNNARTDLTLRTNKDNPAVAKGIIHCIEYIEKFFDIKEGTGAIIAFGTQKQEGW